MGATTGQFTFTDFGWPNAAGPAPDLLQDLAQVVAVGGTAVQDLFATDIGALAALRRAAAGGDTAWLSGTDNQTGLPTRYVAVGDTFLTVGMAPADGAASVMTDGAADDTPVGYTYLTLVTGADSATPQVTQLLSCVATYRGAAITPLATTDGLRALISGLVDKVTSFVRDLFELAWELPAASDVGAAADSAAGAVDGAAGGASGPAVITGPGGVQIDTEVAMTTGEAVSLGLGLVVILALFPLELLEKRMTGYVRVYNATDVDLDVSLAWLHPQNSYAGPTAPQAVTLSAVGPVWTPPWIIGSTAASYGAWVVGNTDTLTRVAYVLRIAATGSFPGAGVMVDIPNAGANSLAIGVGMGDDAEGFWAANHGKDVGLVTSATAGPFEIRIATNRTSGRSPAPTDGALGYNFEHLVLVGPAS